MRNLLTLLVLGMLTSIAVVGAHAAQAASATPQKTVLVLHSTRRDAQVVTTTERELPRILDRGVGAHVDYYSEFIDQARFGDPESQQALRDFLRLRYRGRRFDLVVAIQDQAVQFVDENREALFPETPVVFAASARGVRPLANSTGIITGYDFGSSLGLAARLQPDARQVFVVTGANADDKAFERIARTQFEPYESRFAITYLTGLPTPELEARLATLPAQSLVYYLLVDQDGDGEYFHPLIYLDRVTAVANAPVYTWVDSGMDRGILGGHLRSLMKQTEAVGELAVRVLRGERAANIPVSTPDLHVDQIDWRQLQRWGISEAHVPPGTLVQFRDPSLWDRYRVQILAAGGVLLAQTALIAGLLLQRARRRRAEEQLRTSETELRRSYQRNRDIAGRLLSAQETERARIARELHDDISQQLALLTVDLESLDAGSDGTGELTEDVVLRAHSIARSVHDLSHRLHPAKLRLIGLVPALNALQRELSQPGIAITFTHSGVPPRLAPDLTVCLFRIVQEALRNAVKHSDARSVSVQLLGEAHGIVLTVADDGKGFDVESAWGRGLGLISISERLDAIGGTVDVRSAPGAGTRLDILVPMEAIRTLESAAERPEFGRADSA